MKTLKHQICDDRPDHLEDDTALSMSDVFTGGVSGFLVLDGDDKDIDALVGEVHAAPRSAWSLCRWLRQSAICCRGNFVELCPQIVLSRVKFP